ncbi:unnamed protein product [Ascophyllum nodosum]
MEDYEGELFEKEDEMLEERRQDSSRGPTEVVHGDWKSISFDEVELEDQIGGGSVGLVHRGKYLGQAVALKTLFDVRIDEDLKREYLDELLVLSQLRHPNIVHLYGACMVPPNLFYVMELCQRSLFDLLHNCRRDIGTRERVTMALDVSRALNYLHSRSPPIIHRDLKSLNLLLAGEKGPVKLCDFGLVRTSLTSAGTPAYMAPELLQERPFNKSVDVYAFGILLWEIFYREIPFKGYEASDIRGVVVSGGRPKIPRGACPPEISRLMCRCWSQNPPQRPTSGDIESFTLELQRATPEHEVLKGMASVGEDCLDDLLRK